MNYWSSKRLNLLIIGLLLFLSSCSKTKSPQPQDEIPQILAMSIPGIPQENITINELERLITIVVPTTLPSLEITPSFKISDGANIDGNWGTGKKTISFAGYCPCVNNHEREEDFDRIEDIRLDNATKTGYYKIQLVKSGKQLSILLPDGPIDLKIKSRPLNIYFPVDNYYGSSYIQYLSITKTGSSGPEWISGGDVCFDTCEGKLNEVGIPISGYLIGPYESSVLSFTPGYYDLDLLFYDQTKLHVEKAILMR